MRMRKKKNLVPRMERCAAVWVREPQEHRGHWRALFEGRCMWNWAVVKAASQRKPP